MEWLFVKNNVCFAVASATREWHSRSVAKPAGKCLLVASHWVPHRAGSAAAVSQAGGARPGCPVSNTSR
jgi:hypothetical protein